MHLNPKQLDRFRDRLAGAKDDRRDAMVLADSLRMDTRLFHRVRLDKDDVILLREFVRSDDDLAKENNDRQEQARPSRDASRHEQQASERHLPLAQVDVHAKAHSAALRVRGHSHGRALRSVADRNLRLLMAMLRDGTLYDPDHTPENHHRCRCRLKTGVDAQLPRHESPTAAAETQARAFSSGEEPAERTGKNVLAGVGAETTISHQRRYPAGACRRINRSTKGEKPPPGNTLARHPPTVTVDPWNVWSSSPRTGRRAPRSTCARPG